MTDLDDLLDRASDDAHVPLETDLGDLVQRARTARHQGRVRRAAGATLAVGAVAVLVVGAGLLRPAHHDVPPSPTGPSHSPTAPPAVEPVGLSPTQTIDRCRTQLAAYRELPMYTSHPDRADWSLVQPARYQPGDLVLVDPGDGSNAEFCRVPTSAHAHDRLPLASYTGDASRPGDLVQNCRQLAAYAGAPLAHPEALRLTAADSDGPVTAAVLDDGREPALCSLAPVTWDSLTEVDAFGGGVTLSESTTGGSNKSIVDQTASWYLLGGKVSPEAARVELSVAGGPSADFAVHDRYVAGVLRDPRPGGLQSVTWRVLDARGHVLSSGGE